MMIKREVPKTEMVALARVFHCKLKVRAWLGGARVPVVLQSPFTYRGTSQFLRVRDRKDWSHKSYNVRFFLLSINKPVWYRPRWRWRRYETMMNLHLPGSASIPLRFVGSSSVL